MVSEASFAGVGRHVLDLAQGLCESNCEVHLVYSPVRMSQSFSSRLASLVQVQSHSVEMRRSPHPSDIHVVRAVRQYMAQHGPFDVIHGHSSKGGAIARIAGIGHSAKTFFTPNSFVSMNPEFSGAVSAIYQGVERILGTVTDRFIAVAEEERQEMIRVVSAKRTVVVPNCIASPAFLSSEQARLELGLSVSSTVVGFVGRMSQQKAPLSLVEAFAVVRHTHPSAVLVMIGDGPLLDAVKDRVRTLGIKDNIRLTGERDAAPLMPAFDIFALPSLYEGMPYVLLEAVHAGLPIVSSRVSGASQLVEPGVNGYLVDPSASAETVINSFANAISELISNAEQRRRFSTASIQIAKKFPMQRMIDETLALYRSVC